MHQIRYNIETIKDSLGTMYNDACKSRTSTITIKKVTFEAIGNGIQQA